MSFTQTHEVQTTLAEYMRELPKAVGHLDFEVAGNEVTVTDGDRKVVIDLIYEGNRHLGSLDLPMTRADFELIGYNQEGIAAFMERFNLHTQRLGG